MKNNDKLGKKKEHILKINETRKTRKTILKNNKTQRKRRNHIIKNHGK